MAISGRIPVVCRMHFDSANNLYVVTISYQEVSDSGIRRRKRAPVRFASLTEAQQYQKDVWQGTA